MADLTGMLQAAAGVSTGNPWDISAAVYNGTPFNVFATAPQATNPRGMFFKPDGTKFYVINLTNDSVYEYETQTAWDINNASSIQSLSVSAQESLPYSVFFKPDGTKMYVLGRQNGLSEYDLSTAWDISSASFVRSQAVDGRGETQETGVAFKSDGTRMWIVGSAYDHITQYNLSTAWNISTLVYDRELSISFYETTAQDLFFKPDGTKMWVIGTGGEIHEWDLPNAWNVDGASFNQDHTITINSASVSTSALFFESDGTQLYIVSTSPQVIYQLQLSSAWNMTTASYSLPTTNYFSVAAQDTSPQCIFFKPDGTKMYIVGQAGLDINEYDLSTAWNITTASYVQNFSVSSQDTNPRGLFFKSDGTKMYVVGSTDDDVNEYDLSVAWDISTASYVQNFSVSTEDASPNGLFFKPDGTKMYVVGLSGDEVNEYNLGTAWNISTASYVQNFSVSAQEASPLNVFFKPDGTKMYVSGVSGDDVNEYDLSTPWDISTASYLQNFSVYAQDSSPTGLFFKPDGRQFFIVGGSSDAVWSYDL